MRYLKEPDNPGLFGTMLNLGVSYLAGNALGGIAGGAAADGAMAGSIGKEAASSAIAGGIGKEAASLAAGNAMQASSPFKTSFGSYLQNNLPGMYLKQRNQNNTAGGTFGSNYNMDYQPQTPQYDFMNQQPQQFNFTYTPQSLVEYNRRRFG